MSEFDSAERSRLNELVFREFWGFLRSLAIAKRGSCRFQESTRNSWRSYGCLINHFGV